MKRLYREPSPVDELSLDLFAIFMSADSAVAAVPSQRDALGCRGLALHCTLLLDFQRSDHFQFPPLIGRARRDRLAMLFR
jgi:hypothetical protein